MGTWDVLHSSLVRIFEIFHNEKLKKVKSNLKRKEGREERKKERRKERKKEEKK